MQKALFFIGLLLFLASCNKDDSQNDASEPQPKTFNIADVHVLMGTVGSSSEKYAYAINSNNELAPFEILDANHDVISNEDLKFTISSAHCFDKNYLALSGAFWGSEESYYKDKIVDISTGEFYAFEFNNSFNNSYTKPEFINNSIYYFRPVLGICRLNLSNLPSLQEEVYISNVDQHIAFSVDNVGNVLFYERNDSWWFKTTDGNIVELMNQSSDEILYNSWKDKEGVIHIFTRDKYSSVVSIYKLNSENGVLIKDLIYSADFSAIQDGMPIFNLLMNYSINFNCGNKACFFNNHDYIFLFDHSVNDFLRINLPDLQGYPKLINTEDFIYVVGDSQVYKINPNTGSSIVLIEEGKYQIEKIAADKNNNLYFNALRLSDNKYIIGKVDDSGVFQMIDDQLNKEMEFLMVIDK